MGVHQVRAIFLDRDGVLNGVVLKNGKPCPPESAKDCVILPGVSEALHALKRAGFCLIVATNQPDVARGTRDKKSVEEIHQKLMRELPLDKIMTCFHDDRDNCACRKPKPGLLLQAASAFGIDLSRSVMIGDRWRDIAAGKAAGVKTIWINGRYREKQPEEHDHEVSSLPEALPWIFSAISNKLVPKGKEIFLSM